MAVAPGRGSRRAERRTQATMPKEGRQSAGAPNSEEETFGRGGWRGQETPPPRERPRHPPTVVAGAPCPATRPDRRSPLWRGLLTPPPAPTEGLHRCGGVS